MSKKLLLLGLAVAFCLGTLAQATTIIWVSDNKNPTDNVAADQGWIDLLEAEGFTVDLSFRNAEGRDLDDAEIEALNAAGLIIISRDANSGDYDDGDEPTQWNSIETPIMMQIAHIMRSNRWRWLDTTNTAGGQPAMQVVDTGHPIFAGVALDANNQVAFVEGQDSSITNVTDAGNGTVLATKADDGGVWIAEWEQGVEYYAGSGQFAGGKRMWFAAGGTSPDGTYNLTADGEMIFLNAVRYLLGASKRVKASKPVPADGELYPDTWVNLGWRAADGAVSHDVYLGEDYDSVNDGLAETFRGNQGDTSFIVGFPGFAYPDGLVPGTTYYWRIDEVNDADPNSPYKGDIWSFSVPPKTAYSPDPVDGAEFVDPGATLRWTPGFGAKLHTVYIGDNYDDVNDATGGAPRGTATYTPASPLEAEKVYYWRVDEFDIAETHKGDIWSFTTPGAVGNSQPANGAVDVPMITTLSWTPADTAASSDLYFGTDADAVKNATSASPEFTGNKALGSESHDAGKLALDSTYYWRVDAVYPDKTVKGLLWSFATADFISVDDFEAYNDFDPPDPNSNRIFDNWIDGFGTTTNGALVGNDLPPYAGQTIVHGGTQSMPYYYDNNLKTSEATLTLVYPRDWTEEGVANLSLWFRGNPTNATEQMYIALNGTAVVYHDDPAAAQTGRWTEWVIPLQAFADQGVNLANVNTISIGFGDKNAVSAGGSGTVYFDDISLYPLEDAAGQ
jgi:hypothetical protein